MAGNAPWSPCLPFVSQRYVVRAAELMANDAAQNAGTYAERYRAVIAALCGEFGAETVNLVVAHGMVRGGRSAAASGSPDASRTTGSTRPSFPPSAQYVALGHLHRTQQLPGAAPIWYSGSPIQVDFGEDGDAKHVLVVDVEAGQARAGHRAPPRSARRLRTIEGTLAELTILAPDMGDDLLRVVVTEPGRAGLATDVPRIATQCDRDSTSAL